MDVTLTEWRPVPSMLVRRMKTSLEDEMMLRIGRKADRVEVHPLLRLADVGRSKTDMTLRYNQSRGTKRHTLIGERLTFTHADRQLARVKERGPRHGDLHHPPHITRPPLSPWRLTWADEIHRYTKERDERLNAVFNSWKAIRPLSERSHRLQMRRQKRSTSTVCRPIAVCDDVTWFTRRNLPSARVIDHVTTMGELQKATDWWKSTPRPHVSSPDWLKHEVLIHVCSTPDMVEEREFLAEVTYQEIENACQTLGLSVHIRDLRLGYDRLADDPEAVKICLSDIDRCVVYSAATCFIAIIGNDLDTTLIPHNIDCKVFDAMRILLLKDQSNDLDTLDDAYRLDNNAIPPAYFFKAADVADDRKTTHRLHHLIHETAFAAVSSGLIEFDDARALTLSLTHKEVERGFLQTDISDMRSLCFMTSNGTDVTGTAEIDDTVATAVDLRGDIEAFVHKQMSDNLVYLMSKSQQRDYFKKLHESVKSYVLNQIADCVKTFNFDIKTHITIDTEIYNHSNMTEGLVASYTGPERLLDEVKLLETQPKFCYLFGNAGCGKTIITAKLATELIEKTESIVVVRYLGTTVDSHRIPHALRTSCIELARRYNISYTDTRIIKDHLDTNQFGKPLSLLHKLLEHRRIFILLDGIENDKSGYKLSDIQVDVPDGVTLVVTSRTDTYNKLTSEDRRQFPIFTHDCSDMFESILYEITETLAQRQSRCLTEDQINASIERMTEERSPLLLTFVVHDAMKWPSDYLPDRDYLSRTVANVIGHILMTTEQRYSRALVKFTLTYLAIAKYGLTEKELTELVSKNDTFLMEQVDEGSPSSEGILLHMSIARILSEVAIFLTHFKSDAETVCCIKYNDFRIQVIKRFANEQVQIDLHLELAEYFLKQGQYLSPNDNCSEGKWLEFLGTRRQLALLYHLTHANSEGNPTIDNVKSQCVFNITWLTTRVCRESVGIGHLIDDIEESAKILNIAPINYFYMCLKQCGVVQSECTVLALSTILNHMSHKFENVNAILHVSSQVKLWLRNSKQFILKPLREPYGVFGSIERTVADVHEVIHVDESQNRVLFIDMQRNLGWMDIRTAEKQWPFHITIARNSVTSLNDEILRVVDGDEIVSIDIRNATLKSVSQLPLELTQQVSTTNEFCIIRHDHKVSLFYFYNEAMITLPCMNDCYWLCLLPKDPPIIVCACRGTVGFYKTDNISLPKKVDVNPEEKYIEQQCLQTTRDEKYVVATSQKTMTVIDADRMCFYDEFVIPNGVIVNCTLNRCNEHAFIADDEGVIRVVPLRTCEELFSIDTGSSAHRFVTCQTFSEDDHFLITGFSNGQISIYSIPVKSHVITFQSHHSSISRLEFIRTRVSFETLISKSHEGSNVQLHDLQSLLLKARQKLVNEINDDDLRQEETVKLNVTRYFGVFEPRKDNRMFLNGADVAVFYEQVQPNHFSLLNGFGLTIPHEDYWKTSRKLCDLRSVDGVGFIGRSLVTKVCDEIAIWRSENGKLAKCFTTHRAETTQQLMKVQMSDNGHHVIETYGDRDLFTVQVLNVDDENVDTHMANLALVTTSDNGDFMVCCQVTDERYHVTLLDLNKRHRVLQCPTTAEVDLTSSTHSFLSNDGRFWIVIVHRHGTSHVMISDTTFTIEQRQPEPMKLLPFVVVDVFTTVNKATLIGDETRLLMSLGNTLVIFDIPKAQITNVESGTKLVAASQSEKRIVTFEFTSDHKNVSHPNVENGLDKHSSKFEPNKPHDTSGKLNDTQTTVKSILESDSQSEGDPITLLLDNKTGDVMVSVYNNKVIVWRRSTLEKIGVIDVSHSVQVRCVAIHPEDAYIATATTNGMIQVWQTDTCHLVACHPALQLVTSLHYTHNGDVMAVAGNLHKCRFLIFTQPHHQTI